MTVLYVLGMDPPAAFGHEALVSSVGVRGLQLPKRGCEVQFHQ